jgi:hypothetical protein
MIRIERRSESPYSHAFGKIGDWLIEFKPSKPAIKIVYKFFVYDPKTGTKVRFAEMPERRRDPKRMGKETILNWLRVTYGAKWFEEHKNFIGVIKVRVKYEHPNQVIF